MSLKNSIVVFRAVVFSSLDVGSDDFVPIHFNCLGLNLSNSSQEITGIR